MASGPRSLPGVALPVLVVTFLALLCGERLRAGGRVTASPSTCDSIAPTVPALPPSTAAPRRVFLAGGKTRAGPPTVRHLDPARTNRSPFRAPLRPRVAWTFAAGAPIAMTPVIAGGRLVVGTLAGEVIFLGLDGVAHARTTVGQRLYGSPAVIGPRVWLGADHGLVLALNPDDGKITRRLRLESAADDADTAILPGQPAGDDAGPGSIVFAAGPTVYAAASDGRFLFRTSLGRKIYGSPARLLDGGIVVGGQDDALHLLEPDGSVRARVPLGGDVDGSPAVGDDGSIFVGTDADEVVSVSPLGAVRWRTAVGGPVRGALAVARDGTVLASTYGSAVAIVALTPDRGAEVFRHRLPGTGAREYGIHGAPIEAADGTLLFGGPDDQVHALTPAGDALWSVQVDGDVDGTLVLVDDEVLVACTSEGTVVRIEDTP